MAMKTIGMAVLKYIGFCIAGLITGATLVCLVISPIPTITAVIVVGMSLLTKREKVPMFLLGFILWAGSWFWYDSQNLVLALTCSSMYAAGVVLWWFASAIPFLKTIENRFPRVFGQT